MQSETTQVPLISIVGDDALLCDRLSEAIRSWGMLPRVIAHPVLVDGMANGEWGSVFVLDMDTPGIDGPGLIIELCNHFPEAKVVAATVDFSKGKILRALRACAFDIIQKPVDQDELLGIIRRALEAQERERRARSELVRSLEEGQSKLVDQAKRLEILNQRLVENNRAFTILSRNFELEREELHKQIAHKVGAILMPTINRLRKDKDLRKFALELDLLHDTVRDLTSGLGMEKQIAAILSKTEVRIASLIRSGLTTAQIAEALSISPDTVRTHCKNIRKKLRINDQQHSLKNYLLRA